MLLASTIGDLGGFISGVVAAVGLLGGIGYWMIRRAVGVATKEFVEEKVNKEMSPIQEKVESASAMAAENREELEGLHDLLRGGNSQFEKGMMDFLDDNMERTVEIQEDLDEIKERLTTMRAQVGETELENHRGRENEHDDAPDGKPQSD